MVVKHSIVIILFFLIGCKDAEKNKIETLETTKQDSLPISKKRKEDSLLVIKKNKENFFITLAKNKKFLANVYENVNYKKENDFNNIKTLLLETPIEIDFTYLKNKTNKKGIIFQNFGLVNYLEYKEPYKEYFPFINQKTKQIDFIVSYDESFKNSLKISFKKGQHFWFGENFKWITPKINLPKKLLNLQGDYQVFDKNSFTNPNFMMSIRGGSLLDFKNKKYLLFTFWDGMWCIHHLFDITNESNIKYYILNGIYTDEDGYGDFDKDGQLDFKQKYFYKRNSIDTTQNKYKIYTIK